MSKPPALPWLAWWPADYLGATRAMTIAERGAYIDLLNYSWLNGPLPHEPDRLARMIGVTPQEFAAVWPMIRPKFEVTPHGLVNNRMERERQIAIANQGKRSDKASKAAGARWGTSDAQSSAPSINSRPASDAPSNARSNAPSIGAPQPEAQKADFMLGAMLEQCSLPSPLPLQLPSESPAPPHVGGGKEGNGEKRGNPSRISVPSEPQGRADAQPVRVGDGLNGKITKAETPPAPPRPGLIQMWEATRLTILEGIDAHPKWSNEQIATEALARSVTKEQVATARKTRGESDVKMAKH